MKKFAVLFLIQICCFQSIAQNLSIADLQAIYKLPNWEAVDVYLNNKGWRYENSKKEADGESIICWTYKKSTIEQKAVGWFYLTLSGVKFKELKYELSDANKYNLEKSSVTKYEYEFQDSEVYDDALISEYKNKNFRLFFITTKESDSYEDVVIRTIYMERIAKEVVTTFDNTNTSDLIPLHLAVINLTINDIDGNSYKTVKIGDQVWMAENLNVTKYNDGTPIPIVTDPTIWSNMTNPAMCWYDNDKNKYSINKYGALYNFYTVNTGKLCPTGWHVPSDGDWKILSEFLGGHNVSGTKLKSVFSWESNVSGTNSSGFSGLAAGYRVSDTGSFVFIKKRTSFWSIADYTSNTLIMSYLSYDSQFLNAFLVDKKDGLSVRCIKN